MSNKNIYKVLETLTFKDEEYKAGEELELTDKQAEKLLADNLIELKVDAGDDANTGEVQADQVHDYVPPLFYRDEEIVGEVTGTLLGNTLYKDFKTIKGTTFRVSVEDFNSNVK